MSGGLHGNIEHNHIHPEDAPIRWKSQVDFTEASGRITDMLRIRADVMVLSGGVQL
jgi:hypothetical protein